MKQLIVEWREGKEIKSQVINNKITDNAHFYLEVSHWLKKHTWIFGRKLTRIVLKNGNSAWQTKKYTFYLQ